MNQAASGTAFQIGNGYTCSSCGMWVYYNTTHNCQWTWPYPQPARLTDDEIEKIAKRVVQLLGANPKRVGPGLGVGKNV